MKTEWVHKKLGELVVDSYAGGTPNRGREDYFGGDIPWVSSGEVNNPIITSTIEKITLDGLNNSSARWIPENSILLALYGATAGQVSMLKIKATANQAVLAIIPNDQEVDTDFLYYQIVNNKQKLLFLAQGSGQPNLSKNIVDRLPISYPTSLPAQRRIAAILSSADKVIASTQKVIAKYKQMKQGMMEDLLKPKEGWKMVRLGDVGEIVTGSTPATTKAEYWDGEYNFYSPADFGENVYCAKTDRTITAAGMKTGRPVPANSIMVACIASIGKIAINRTEGITNQQINTIIPNDDYNFRFLYYLLSFNVEKIKGKAAQTTIPIINKEDFSNLEFSVPILAEQRRMAAILLGIDAKIIAEQAILNKYTLIKKGLMEKLLNEK